MLLNTSAQALILSLLISGTSSFNPYDYTRKTVHCDAVQREPQRDIKIELSYVDVNDKVPETVLMVHGWPSVWSTWSKQIEGLKDENYRLIAPDLRGFGYSSHTQDFKSSHTMGDIVQDLTCILEHAGVQSAICMGHDWGSQVCYEAARMRPDIFTAVVAIAIPYIPSIGPYFSVKRLVPAFPRLAYQTFFDRDTENAAKELERDIRRSLRATLRSIASPPPNAFLESEESFLDAWKDIEEIPPIPFLSKQEEDYLVEAFERQGFLYTFGFYTEESRQISYTFSYGQGNHTIPQPVLSILPTADPVADWQHVMKLLKSEEFLPSLTLKIVEAAHWLHLENPEEVNQAIKDWLRTLRASPKENRLDDEL
ncbi:hypothetical protein AGABI2DRAFT_184905 [Agaricus bisporus var. bisporus H97]|uniref:hypothetical protein n=1 Tax=Agaricus bisporus var. bisporus (strain H97 / ATCC MYA-4626 / FGSC 10389) TaxID=936046 RepID=UPI00029F6589|nr:hypothetical protein AGABI2DRAFT_184905 [Agaricus bisporus var. bisporus H97]EKV48583.1 hypothetical protein AGABI2DRAFT_184905 [Agaricus bisporus var. bisporus H97]